MWLCVSRHSAIVAHYSDSVNRGGVAIMLSFEQKGLQQLPYSGRNLELFRTKITMYSRLVSKCQRDLAEKLAISRSFLTKKLNGNEGYCLTNCEVKEIVKALVEWQAINTQTEALELLKIMNLGPCNFTSDEWNSYPLSHLILTNAFNNNQTLWA